MQMLVTLILEGCISLLKIHPSIGNLGRLQFLNLEDCKEIKNIPDDIRNLKLLEYLNLNGCSKLEGLPDNLGEIETLRELSADETAIKQLPSSLSCLKSLTSLSLEGCNKKSAKRSWFPVFPLRESSDTISLLPRSISGLSALRRFNLRDCNLSDQEIPADIGSLFALQELDLTGNSLSRLPQSFMHLTNLESLYLDNWNDLCSQLPASVRSLVPTTFRSRQHNVFLSFTDSGDTFSNNLYTALVDSGVYIFRDDEPGVGGIISHKLIPAIKESRIAIIVLSINFASSSWCLDSLAKIIECKQANGKVVLPIFYNVDQIDVSFRQIGSFAEAFRKHKARYMLDRQVRWEDALICTANLRGFSLQDFNGSESSLISHIVKEVQWELKRLFVAKHPVGLKSRLKNVRKLLQLEFNSILVLMICGEVGSGKSVIAKALYNESLQHFDCSCFLADIGRVSARPNGLVYLQNQLLYQLGMEENGKVESVAEGIKVIEKMCHHKKVLIVLDGLYNDEEEKHASALLGNRNTYGPGSRIIFVAADYSLRWSYIHKFSRDESYTTELLNREEAMELLSRHSFGTPTLPTGYVKLAEEFRWNILTHGNPLVIVVLGTFLYGRSIHEWSSAVETRWKIPHQAIIEMLKSVRGEIYENYDTIHVIICTAFVIETFSGCGGVNSDFGVKFLLDKCFPLNPNWYNDPRVREMLRGMGFRSLFPEIQ